MFGNTNPYSSFSSVNSPLDHFPLNDNFRNLKYEKAILVQKGSQNKHFLSGSRFSHRPAEWGQRVCDQKSCYQQSLKCAASLGVQTPAGTCHPVISSAPLCFSGSHPPVMTLPSLFRTLIWTRSWRCGSLASWRRWCMTPSSWHRKGRQPQTSSGESSDGTPFRTRLLVSRCQIKESVKYFWCHYKGKIVEQ